MKWFFFSSLLMLISCASIESLPTEEMAEQKFKASEFNDKTNNFIEVISFHKTNGIKATIFGVENYRIEFAMAIKFKQNAHNIYADEFKRFETDKEFYKWLNKQPKHSSSGDNHQEYYNNFKHFKKGETTEIIGNVDFVKTENGWR